MNPSVADRRAPPAGLHGPGAVGSADRERAAPPARQPRADDGLTPELCQWVDRRAAQAWARALARAETGRTAGERREAGRVADRIGAYLVDRARARKWRRPPGAANHYANHVRAVTGVRWHQRERRGEVLARLLDMGVCIEDLLDDTDAKRRWAAAESIAGLKTRTNVPRDMRLRMCGRCHVAASGRTIGLAHQWCRDRVCPACGEMRARTLASSLRAFTSWRAREVKHEIGSKRADARLLFVTLTQPKQSDAEESATEAVSRALSAFKRLTNTRTNLGRAVRGGVRRYKVDGRWHSAREAGVLQGGVRSLEVTHAKRGDKTQGHVVAYSGWHAHFHCVFEVADGVSAQEAQRVLTVAWLSITGGSAAALDFQSVDLSRVGQLAKYCVKPGEFAASGMVEVARALESRKLTDAFGTWRGVVGKGKEMASAAADEKVEAARLAAIAQGRQPPETRQPVRLADQSIGELPEYVEARGMVRFAWRVEGGDVVERFEVAADCERGIAVDPRTWERKDADRREAEIKPFDNEPKEWSHRREDGKTGNEKIDVRALARTRTRLGLLAKQRRRFGRGYVESALGDLGERADRERAVRGLVRGPEDGGETPLRVETDERRLRETIVDAPRRRDVPRWVKRRQERNASAAERRRKRCET